jgi:hypothetical protein
MSARSQICREVFAEKEKESQVYVHDAIHSQANVG